MSRSSTPDTVDTQIWEPITSDRKLQLQPAEREYKPQFLPRRDFRRLDSSESFSTLGSFRLDETPNPTSHQAPRHANHQQPHNPGSQQRLSSSSSLSQQDDDDPPSPDSFTLTDSTDVTPLQAPFETSYMGPQHNSHPRISEEYDEGDRRDSIASFRTTGSFALDEPTASRWEMERGWPGVQSKPLKQQEPNPMPVTRPQPLRNFSRPLRVVEPAFSQVTQAQRPAQATSGAQVPASQKSPPALLSHDNSGTSSSDTTFRSSLASDSDDDDSSDTSSASSVVLREEEYPASPQNPQPAFAPPPIEAQRSGPPSSNFFNGRQKPTRGAMPPSFITRGSLPTIPERPLAPNRKQVSFDSHGPPASISESTYSDSIIEEAPLSATSSRPTSSNHSLEITRAAPPPNAQPPTSIKTPSINTPSIKAPSINAPSIRAPSVHAPSLKHTISRDSASHNSNSAGSSRPSARSTPSINTITTIGTHNSGGSGGSTTSISTNALAEAFRASNYDISALSPKELEKLKKKGVDPALYLEMKAATMKRTQDKDEGREKKKGGRFKLGGRPLVGNAFIG